MLPPNELKNKKFSKVVRGYSMVEVDEHIEFIIDKYTELYRENDDLERKLRVTLAKLDVIKKDEESIRSALINAQRASSSIINEANERAEVVMRATKTNCDKILSDFRTDIRAERDRLLKLRAIVAEFKKELFDIYNTHIEYIDTINPDAGENDDLKITEEVFVRRAITEIKKDIAENIEQITKRETAKPEPQAEIPDKNMPVSGQLTTPEILNETNGKKDQTSARKTPETVKNPSEIISEVKNAPVSEDFAPENIAVPQPDLKNEFKPGVDFEEEEESDFEDEFDFEEEIIPEDEFEPEEESVPEDKTEQEESVSEERFEDEEEFIPDDETEEEPEPAKNIPAFVRGAVTVPKNIQRKGSVKDTIRELNKIFNTADNDLAESKKDENIKSKTTANITEEDDFGEEEFDDYNPVMSVQPSKPQSDENDQKSETAETDEDKEYRDFIKSIEDAAENRQTDKNIKKQKKNRPKPVTKDGKEFDFL
ncbi:MAG: DivIVA domain-containing protein [Eubacteriales bacterium]